MSAYQFHGKVNISMSHSRARNVHDAFDKVHQLGHGTYGEVYLARDRTHGNFVALKKIKLEATKEKRQGFPITAIREMRVLQMLKHENVVRLLEVFFECNGFKGSIYLVFEYLDHDLCGLHERMQKAVPNRPGAVMPPAMAKSFVQQLLRGLAYCHERGVLHRDLKASNLLISTDGTLKLADFGLARQYTQHLREGGVREGGGELTYRVCTLWYRPPELLLGSQSYGAEVDVWSAGCILWELLAGSALFGGNKEMAMLARISDVLGKPDWPGDEAKGIPPAASLKHYEKLAQAAGSGLLGHCKKHKVPDDAAELLTRMLALNPAERPSASECLQHSYFANQPTPMTAAEFQRATAGFAASHEYVVKGKASKRARPDDHAEMSTPRNAQPACTLGGVATHSPPPGFRGDTDHAVVRAASGTWPGFGVSGAHVAMHGHGAMGYTGGDMRQGGYAHAVYGYAGPQSTRVAAHHAGPGSRYSAR